MDTKKISFGFTKVTKKLNILPAKPAKEESQVELIKCLEGKEIKLVAEKEETAPLVIAMGTNQKTSAALASLMKRRAVLLGEDDVPEESTEQPQSIAEVVTANKNGNSLEQRAALELLAATQTNGENVEQEKLVLPALKADELPLDGAKESSIDDYESIPIQQFGLAMLRGMGWVEPPPKKKNAGPIDDAPFLRPKGMGLGADKALKAKPLLVQPETNEVLQIKKQAFVRILGGKHKDQYGQIEGFDDHAGRVIVKMGIGGAKEAFNEFLCQPVSKKEFAQYGKCINTAKYEEYKKQENEHGQIIIKHEKSTDARNDNEDRKGHKDERKLLKSEDRKPNKSEDRKYFKDEDSTEDRKPFRTEERRHKDEDRTDDRKPYKTEERKSYKDDYKREAYKSSNFSTSSRYHERDHESRTTNAFKSSTQRYREESARNSRDRRRSYSPKSSCRRQQSSSDEAEDTGESTESDSDSAYERKHKKKSSSSKSKKKKSKKPKNKSHRRKHDSTNSSEESEDCLERARHKNKHKKKTKKSKHARSRTRSRSRERVRTR